MSILNDRQVAVCIVEAAGITAGELRTQVLSEGSETKAGPADLVTVADRAAEERMRSLLQSLRHDDDIIGEEFGGDITSGRHWLLDPVDGTHNYASGSEYWCSVAACMDGDEVVASAIHQRGHGTVSADMDGIHFQSTYQPTRRPYRKLEEAAVATYLSARWWSQPEWAQGITQVLKAAGSSRSDGALCLDLLRVAAGEVDAMAIPMFDKPITPWDWFPGKLLVEKSGGVTAQPVIGKLHWYIAARDQALLDELLAIIT